MKLCFSKFRFENMIFVNAFKLPYIEYLGFAGGGSVSIRAYRVS